jgi:hypothetical protein
VAGDYEVQADGSLRDSYTHYLSCKSVGKGGEVRSLSLLVCLVFVNDKTFYTEGKEI